MVKGSLGAFPGYGRGGGLTWRGHTPTKVVAGVVALLVAFSVFFAPDAKAFFFVNPSPSFPVQTVVGQTSPAALGISNNSTPPESTSNPILTISDIDLYPACTSGAQDCLGGTPEAGVFALSATGTGSSTPPGNATCEGTWTIVPDTGDPNTATRYRFVPPNGEGTLLLATGETCSVSFTYLTLAGAHHRHAARPCRRADPGHGQLHRRRADHSSVPQQRQRHHHRRRGHPRPHHPCGPEQSRDPRHHLRHRLPRPAEPAVVGRRRRRPPAPSPSTSTDPTTSRARVRSSSPTPFR